MPPIVAAIDSNGSSHRRRRRSGGAVTAGGFVPVGFVGRAVRAGVRVMAADIMPTATLRNKSSHSATADNSSQS
jgi:hypothetical protein